jgi:hypothetical protein
VRRREAGGAANQVGHIDGVATCDANAREVEEFGQQSGQAIAFAHHQRRERALIFARVRHTAQLLDGAANRRQRILDLVRE